MTTASEGYRQAYTHWLRSGRWVRPYGFDGRELKFNPYHDPRNGQFTFAPGGSRSLSHIVVSDREGRRSRIEAPFEPPARSQTADAEARVNTNSNGEVTDPAVQFADRSNRPSMRRGSNSRAFDEPMTLEQAFPGLRTAPGGELVAVADGFFDFTGPARATTSELARALANQLKADIRGIIPRYSSSSFGWPSTLEGQHNLINDLRFERAAAYLRYRGDPRPLQTETLRLIQRAADAAYNEALRLHQLGILKTRLSV